METIEERIAFTEGRVEEHIRMVDGIREAVANLEVRMDRRFEAVDRRFEAIDRRFEAVDLRFDGVYRRLLAIEQKLDLRTDALEHKMSHQFMWLVGVQVTTLAAIVAALAAR